MKIIFFTDFFHPSVEGVTASVTLFSNELRHQGHRVFIVAPAPAKPIPNEHPDILRLPSVPSVWHKGLRDGILTPKAGKAIRDMDADIFHFHTLGMTGLAGMRMMLDLDMPSVSTYHTDWEHYSKVYRRMWAGLVTGTLVGPLLANQPKAWPETLAGMKPKRTMKEWNDNMIHNLIRVSYDNFDTIIAPSKKMMTMLESYGVTRPIEILPTGIDPADFLTVQSSPRTSKVPTIIYVGRIAREKNIEVLFDAIKLLRARRENVRLKLVGPGPYLTRFRQKVREAHLGKYVIIDGGLPRAEALAEYSQADIFAFPSLTDTQAIVLNEAAYASLPLLFSDPDISIIAQDKVSGYRIPPTGEAYADAIMDLLAHPKQARQMGQAAHDLAETIYIDRQTKGLVKTYQRTIKQHAKKPL